MSEQKPSSEPSGISKKPLQKSDLVPANQPGSSTQIKRQDYKTGSSADRDRQSRKLDRMVRLTGLSKSLESGRSRKEFIDKLTTDDFIRILKVMYGILLNLPRSERKLDESIAVTRKPNTKVILEVHTAGEDKKPLLQKVLESAQATSEAEDKAMILSVGINAVHPFPDGNGRISRLFYYLLTNGYHTGDKKLLEIMSSSGEMLVSPDPSLIRPAIIGWMEMELGTHKYDNSSNTLIPVLPTTITAHDFGSSKAEQSTLSSTPIYNEVLAILLQEDFGAMIPLLALMSSSEDKLVSARKAIIKKGGKDLFAIDLFLQHAKQEDLEAFRYLFRVVKRSYIIHLINQLALGNESMHILSQDSGGKLKEWPIAELMKAHLAQRT